MTKAEEAVMAWLEWDRSMTKHGNTSETQRLYRKCLALSMDVKGDLDPEIADAHNNHGQDDPEWMTALHYCGEGQLTKESEA